MIDPCLSYESAKRGTAQALTLHKGLATGRDFILQHLVTPAEYEAALKENEWLRTQLNSSTEGASNCASTTTATAVKVKTHSTPHSQFNFTLTSLSESVGLTLLKVAPRMEEEAPIEASWEFNEVRLEEVDDAPLYPSLAPESDTSTPNATSSDAPTVITSSQPEVLEFYNIGS